MAIASPSSQISEAEYMERERRAEFKNEFFRGEVFAMAGGTPAHSQISANLSRLLGTELQARPCVVFTADLRIKVETTGLQTYPDCSVVYGPQHLLGQDVLLNPSLLVEVLSDSSEAYDRGTKFQHYRQIPTLCEYLLASQKAPRLELFVRQNDGQWLWSEAVGLEAVLELPILRVKLPLREVYSKVEFTTSSL